MASFQPFKQHTAAMTISTHAKYVDACSIVGVRKAESAKRKQRTAFETKNKTVLKKNKALIDVYFEENCQSVGTASVHPTKANY